MHSLGNAAQHLNSGTLRGMLAVEASGVYKRSLRVPPTPSPLTATPQPAPIAFISGFLIITSQTSASKGTQF
ncbi:unnamed protein product [Danaus chrysippus]|uniref:(African queen) hypothetical protein n=1 Tax=Danaus chrysippus TaxID=151541 RepID=A0A8J2RAI0_9NEOP|nr:unnamed protein product [Danaus chrysippus]